MGRGSQLAEGIALVDKGPTGIVTTVHFRGDTIVVQRSQDMQEALAYVARRREELEGLPWGTGREVGYIPELFYSKIALIRDPDERKRAVKQFFIDNPAFLYFDKYTRQAAPKERAATPAEVAALITPELPAIAAAGTDSVIASLE